MNNSNLFFTLTLFFFNWLMTTTTTFMNSCYFHLDRMRRGHRLYWLVTASPDRFSHIFALFSLVLSSLWNPTTATQLNQRRRYNKNNSTSFVDFLAALSYPLRMTDQFWTPIAIDILLSSSCVAAASITDWLLRGANSNLFPFKWSFFEPSNDPQQQQQQRHYFLVKSR